MQDFQQNNQQQTGQSGFQSQIQKLNDKQKEAVLHTNGPLLVFAGAGSGKTRALTYRIAYLMKEKGVSPWNILAVTFTNKAANEMKERIVKLIGSEEFKDLPTIGTFHATCVRILRKNIHLLNYENSFTIYDTTDQQILMKNIMKSLQIDEKQINPRAMLSQISNAKNQLITPEKYRAYATNYFTEKVQEVYTHYQRELQKSSALDFDDIIMKTVELFQQEPTVLDRYQEKFRYISIDEYQDTNQAQYVLTTLLAQKYRNLCVIGDSDQSIYRFRGANIQNILDFEKDYPDAKVVLLEQNYRSTQNILDSAHAIINKNTQRKDKKLWTDRMDGEKIIERALDNERAEAQYVMTRIQQHILQHETPSYKDFVVLYRTNAQSRVLEEACLRFGIPYRIVGGIKFYQRKEIKDIIAYLRVIQNPSDTVSLFRIINTPSRKLGARTLEIVQEFARHHNIQVFEAMERSSEIHDLPLAKQETLKQFTELIRYLQKVNTENTVAGLIKYVLEETGYKKLLDDNTVEGESRKENIYELIGVASKYDNLEPGMALNIFLEEIALIADVDSLDDRENSITLMTIHSAKGLEFPVVFIAGLEEGILPHSRSLMDREELEEERRLMYVAITRAKDTLYLLRAKSRMFYGETQSNSPSQFLIDIPAELVDREQQQQVSRDHQTIANNELGYTPIPFEEYEQEGVQLQVGDTVAHPSFGSGTVKNITGGIIQVAFQNPKHGIKKLALSIAPLQKID